MLINGFSRRTFIILFILISFTLIIIIYKLSYYYHHDHQHKLKTFIRISDPNRTDLLRLKYQYNEKQNLLNFLTTPSTSTLYSQQLHSNKTNSSKYQFKDDQQHKIEKFIGISADPNRTDLLRLKYQYNEKQNLTNFLTSVIHSQQLNAEKTNTTMNQSKEKKIYLRNGDFCLYFSKCSKSTPDIFQPPNCPFKCTFVKKIHDKIQANILWTKYGFEAQVFDDEIKPNWTRETVPKDMWKIFSTVEAPTWGYVTIYKHMNFSRERDVMVSFWRGADFHWPYFTWTYYNSEIRRKKQKKDHWSGKSKLAAIFVSNCGGTFNNRSGFLKSLQNHMEVDVYGYCGPLKCSRRNSSTWTWANVGCEEMLGRDYFFYLAFENSNCRDYISEKFYRAVKNGVVPVVLGAHPDDYRDLVPQDSYIHVEDFSNLQDLAKFLVQVSKSRKLYNRFFEWRDTGHFQFHLKYYPSKSSLPCKFCTWLHNMDNMGKMPVRNLTLLHQKGSNRNNFKEDLCLPTNQWYWKPSKIFF